MNNQPNFQGVGLVHQRLQEKYSSLQTYYYSRTINDLIQHKHHPFVLEFQDIEDFVEDDENLKRFYKKNEFKSKLFVFKQYYFYHKDSPRMFISQIEMIYTKWQDRCRQFLYRRLKRLFDESDDKSSEISSQQFAPERNLLFDISEYNPFSKKYYLRTQERLAKNNRAVEREKEKAKTKTKDQISQLKHNLSEMLGDMEDLSVISTLDSGKSHQNRKTKDEKNIKREESQTKEGNGKSYSSIKFNFKRKANIQNQGSGSVEKLKIKCNEVLTPKKRPSDRQSSEDLRRYKSKSIFTPLVFKSENQKEDKNLNSKRGFLRINLDEKSRRKISYNSGEKINEKGRQISSKFASLKSQSSQKLQLRNQGTLQSRQESLRKLKTKPDEFCDFKLNLLPKGDSNIQKYKSQQNCLKKNEMKDRQSANAQPKRTSFKIKGSGERKKAPLKL